MPLMGGCSLCFQYSGCPHWYKKGNPHTSKEVSAAKATLQHNLQDSPESWCIRLHQYLFVADKLTTECRMSFMWPSCYTVKMQKSINSINRCCKTAVALAEIKRNLQKPKVLILPLKKKKKTEFIFMRSKVRGMRVPPELCFYFISVPRLLITKSAKLKDAGAERLVAAPAGKSLCIFNFF